LRKSKQVKINRRKENERLAKEGRTKVQREKIVMKNAINNYDGSLGELKGETIKERYAMMHRLTAHFNAMAKKAKEAAKQE
jgi:hypothetical protein